MVPTGAKRLCAWFFNILRMKFSAQQLEWGWAHLGALGAELSVASGTKAENWSLGGFNILSQSWFNDLSGSASATWDGQTTTITSGSLGVLGDADNSGTVDELDLEIVLANFFVTDPVPLIPQGNFNSDNTVNELDFLIWRTEFLNAGGSLEGLNFSFPVVPEPSSFVLLALGFAMLLNRNRRNSVTR